MNQLQATGAAAEPGGSERWGVLPSSLGESFEVGLSGHSPSQPSQAQSRGRRCGARRLPGSRPALTIGSRVHFCLCHLPSHLQGSHDGFITFLNSFQLSLITLRISKSSQAGADRDGSGPSATQSWFRAIPVVGAFAAGAPGLSALADGRDARSPVPTPVHPGAAPGRAHRSQNWGLASLARGFDCCPESEGR